MSTNFERVNAIQRMLNAPEGSEIKLSTGEIIKPWEILDESGKSVGIEEFTTEQLLKFYSGTQDWGCPNENK